MFDTSLLNLNDSECFGEVKFKL
ncbi:uncharacterized protein METZ01_LOCUS421883 [marine metagenome]|uniref:Uncharacterized protein n=1 Tax=marine metagenome TaxID=408172 RepID=A0A382XDW4_9ZZZZ